MMVTEYAVPLLALNYPCKEYQMVARGIVFESPGLIVKCTLSLTK